MQVKSRSDVVISHLNSRIVPLSSWLRLAQVTYLLCKRIRLRTRCAAEDPDLGYCQGMNMVAALFAVAARSVRVATATAHSAFRVKRGCFRGLRIFG